MNRLKLTCIMVVALVLVALPLLSACGETEVIKEVEVTKIVEKEVIKEVEVDEEIVLGGMFDVTGPYANVQKWWPIMLGHYFEWLNDQGGINGVKVDYRWVDTGHVVPRMLTGYATLKEAGCLAMTTMSGLNDMTLKEKAWQDGITLLSGGPVETSLTEPLSVLAPCLLYEDQGAIWLDYFKENLWKETRAPKLAYLVADSPTGRSLAPGTRDYAESLGIEVVAEVIFPHTAADMSPYLLKVKESGADFMNTVGTPLNYIPMIKGMVELEMDIPFCAAHPICMDDLVLLVPEGMIPNDMVYCADVYTFDANAPGVKLYKDLQSKYTGQVRPGLTTYLFAVGIEMAGAVELALEEIPYKELTPKTLREYGFNRMNNFDPMGIASPVTFGPDRNYGATQANMRVVRDGKVVELGWQNSKDILGLVK